MMVHCTAGNFTWAGTEPKKERAYLQESKAALFLFAREAQAATWDFDLIKYSALRTEETSYYGMHRTCESI